MFNIGMMELILILLVAFLVVGPKDLPKVARWIARQVKNIRKMVREVKKETGWDSFAAELRETEADVKKTFQEADVRGDLRETAKDLDDLKADVKHSMDEVRKDVNSAADMDA